MAQHLYIAIEGPIGVGKSTLARLIQPEFEAKLLMEVFEENPFLTKFYGDREQYAFQTQIFFLLSRYRQQLVAPAMLREATVVGDYTFAKDRLFAHLNVRGDELALYDHLHDLLAERVIAPDLIVYLRADTDVLMERIAIRDRQYERGMDRDYMEALNRAYARFFAEYDRSPVLAIDTNDLNIVRRENDLAHVVQRIRSVLGQGTHQRPLLEEATLDADMVLESAHPGLLDYQRWHQALDQGHGLNSELFFNLLGLQARVGELSTKVMRLMTRQRALQQDGMTVPQAQATAVAEHRDLFCAELSECLSWLFKLANQAEVDLEAAYLQKIQAECDMDGKRGS